MTAIIAPDTETLVQHAARILCQVSGFWSVSRLSTRLRTRLAKRVSGQ